MKLDQHSPTIVPKYSNERRLKHLALNHKVDTIKFSEEDILKAEPSQKQGLFFKLKSELQIIQTNSS